MSKTALDLSPKEWQAYRPNRQTAQQPDLERVERAWQVARTAANLLRQRFGATRVVIFGSLAHHEWFTPWSDVDLAAWGIPPDAFFSAVATVTGLSAEFKVDLVDPQDCEPTLRQTIEQEGVGL
jgi:predicted nucleotidyltransferase